MHKSFPIPSRVWVYENIGMRRNFDVGGGQGSRVNAPQDGVSSIPNLSLSWMNDSFGSTMVMLC